VGILRKSSGLEVAEQPNVFHCVKSAVKLKSSKGGLGIVRGSCEEKPIVFKVFIVCSLTLCINHT
jgi:hypothetical protein